MLCQSKEEMFTKLKKMILLELINFLSPLHLIAKATALNGVGADEIEVTIDSKPCAVTLVLLVAKLAVIKLEVG